MAAPLNNDLLARFDESEAPIISVKYPVHGTPEAIQLGFAEFRRMSEKYKRVVWLLDLRTFNPITGSAAARRAFADEYEKSRFVIEPATIAESRIYSSTIVRGLSTAVDWLLKRPYAIKSFDDYVPALAWARAQLEIERHKKTGLAGLNPR